MNNQEILTHLQNYIRQEEEKNGSKKPSKLLEALKSVSEEGITLGEAPKYFCAYMECNSTGVGVSSFEGTQTQRTVARDYITDEHLFIDGHVGAGAKGLSIFYCKEGQVVHYYQKSDMIKVAKETGFKLHLQHFSDLNIRMRDHRLNRYTAKITKGPFSYPIRPILAVISEKGDQMTIGYLYEKDGCEYIIIEPEEKDIKGGGGKLGCLATGLICMFCPPAILVFGFIWLVKYFKERMVG